MKALVFGPRCVRRRVLPVREPSLPAGSGCAAAAAPPGRAGAKERPPEGPDPGCDDATPRAVPLAGVAKPMLLPEFQGRGAPAGACDRSSGERQAGRRVEGVPGAVSTVTSRRERAPSLPRDRRRGLRRARRAQPAARAVRRGLAWTASGTSDERPSVRAADRTAKRRPNRASRQVRRARPRARPP